VATLEEMSELHLYDFGIFIELAPDEEERQLLENNIQMALAQKIIKLSDAIDIRNTKNVKLANELLKIKEKKKVKEDQAMQQQNIQAQQQAQQQTAQAQAQAETQKQQALTQSQIQLEQAKAEFRAKTLQQEAQIKKDLMEAEFQYNMKLRALEAEGKGMVEDKKQNQAASKKFESAGNDELGTGLNMNQF